MFFICNNTTTVALKSYRKPPKDAHMMKIPLKSTHKLRISKAGAQGSTESQYTSFDIFNWRVSSHNGGRRMIASFKLNYILQQTDTLV